MLDLTEPVKKGRIEVSALLDEVEGLLGEIRRLQHDKPADIVRGGYPDRATKSAPACIGRSWDRYVLGAA